MSSTTPIELLRVWVNDWQINVAMSWPLLFGLALLLLLILILIKWNPFDSWGTPEVELNVPLGGFGSVKIKADYTVSQVAYTAWVELITRKAGLPIDPEHDVIAEIYDSWYQLFGKTRELIKTIPAHQLKRENTKTLIKLLTGTLNKGLRPHLTKWQAKFRRWYTAELEKEKGNGHKTPQEIQKLYPHYAELISDLLIINQQVVSYAGELRKLVRIAVEEE